MEFVDRPQPLADGIKKAAGRARQTEVVLPRDKSFGGTMTWDLSLIIAQHDVGQKFDGRWLTKDGAWAFSFQFGEYGMLECIAEKSNGDSWIMKGLMPDLPAGGKIDHFSSYGSVPDVKMKSTASFMFEVDEQSIPWALKAEVVHASGQTEDIVAQQVATSA